MTNTFEKVYHTDPSRERPYEIEKPSIELSDKEHLERVRTSREMKIVTIHNEPPAIPMDLNMPKLEKAIKEEKKKAKSKSKKAKKAKGSI